ncbi:MAG: L-aspartate oxidase [Chloroflexota bacterium]|nr:L-aspartate oxidase [Chloroflexota bacterium]
MIDQAEQFDYIVIGSGIAGLFTALLAQRHGTVLVLTKGRIDDCNTRYAQGGIAAAIGQGDSPDLHLKDTLVAGAGLCDPEAVRILAHEGPDRIHDLIRLGVPFDTVQGQIALAREAAHSLPRVLHAGGDATGQHIELTLAEAVRQSKVQVREHTLATRLLVKDGAVVGVEALENGTGRRYQVRARFTVLATGGAGRLFRHTTNPEVATGDGVALAFQAGAQLMDMEFYQFHPTAMRLPGVPCFLVSEAARGEGGVLRNVQGRAFMADYHPLADLAPRDVVSRAIVQEMEKAGADHVLLDLTHLPQQQITTRFPNIYRFGLEHGLDITNTPIPVAPAAHYMMGGVKVDASGVSSLPGLYACGEVACGAVHGANRLASNSLLESLVFARRVVDHTAGQPTVEPASLRVEELVTVERRELTDAPLPKLSLEALQDVAWSNLGIVRNGPQLLWAARTLYDWSRTQPPPKDRASYELASLVTVGRLIAEAALLRRESRGAHYRTDFPDTSPEWEKHIVLVKQEGA